MSDGSAASRDELTAEYDRERAALLSSAIGIARVKLRDGLTADALAVLDSAAKRSTEMLREYLIAYGKSPKDVDAFLSITGADRV